MDCCLVNGIDKGRLLQRMRDCTLGLELDRLGEENILRKETAVECGSGRSGERVSEAEAGALCSEMESSHFGMEFEISQLPYEDSSDTDENEDDEETDANKDEEQEEDDDFYLFCEECKSNIKGDCSVHGALVPLDESRGRDKASARHTAVFVPKQLTVRRSTIPEAGLGIFAKEAIPKRVRCGPYKGVMLPAEDVTSDMDASYMWELKKKGSPAFVVDGQDEAKSNWMRFVNCARTESEQNMVAFQYQSSMYYRTYRTIRPGEELLVWYGDQYAEELGIDVSALPNSDPSSADINAVSNPSSEPDNRDGLDPRNDGLGPKKAELGPINAGPGLKNGIDNLGGLNSVIDELNLSSTYNPGELDQTITGLDLGSSEPVLRNPGRDTTNAGLGTSMGETNHGKPVPVRIGRGVRYKCRGCCRSFVENSAFQLHLKNHKDCAKANPSVFTCKHCGARFTRLYSLQLHYFEHVDQRVATNNASEPSPKRKKSANLKPILNTALDWVARSASTRRQTSQESAQESHTPAQGESSGLSITHDNMATQHPPTTITDSPLLQKYIARISSAAGMTKVDRKVFHLCSLCGEGFSSKGQFKCHLTTHFNGSMPGEPKTLEEAFISGPSGPVALPDTLDLSTYSQVDFDHAHYSTEDDELEEPLKRKYTPRKLPRSFKRICCQLCSKNFSYQLSFTKHMQNCHPNGKMSTCSFCSKTFTEKSALLKHEQTHSSDKKFFCLICHKGFINMRNHNRHMKTHQKEKPFQCSECGKHFARQSYLDKHIQTMHNTLTKNLSCSVCCKEFAHKESLRVHMRQHNRPKIHQCEVCSRSFREKSHLNAHLRVHTNDKPYVCKICNVAFAYTYSLTRHMVDHAPYVDVESAYRD